MLTLPMLFPLLAMLLWAGNVVVSKLSAGTIDPSAMTFYRLVVAVALMSLFVLRPLWRNRAAVRPQLGKLAFLGCLSMALYQSLSYLAAHSTTATNMAIVTSLVPLLTMLLSVLLLREPPTLGMVFGGLLSFAGLVYLITRGEPAMLWRQGVHAGDVLMLLASLTYALYSVLLRRWHTGLPAWQSTYVQAVSATICMMPMMAHVPPGGAVLNRASVPLILYAGIFASVVLPFLWIQGIKHLGPNRCSLFMNLLPVFTAAIAVAMLGETLRPYHWIGGGVALAGVALAQTLRRTFGPRRLSIHPEPGGPSRPRA